MRKLTGVLLVLHGLAHAGAGMWSYGPVWLVTIVWWLATTSFMAAGLGLIGVPVFRLDVRNHALRGVVASLVLLAYLPHPLLIPGVLLDLLFVAMVTSWQGVDAPRERPMLPHRTRARVAFGLSTAALVYATCVIALRPWYMRMGTTGADRSAHLFGDSLAPQARYIVNNAITIRAPADSVWPWVAQIGQDRAGFYSYSGLENLFGADIHNADSLVPGWQERAVGELVRAVPPDYFGGRFGPNVGWHITAIDPGRALVLENWGAFIVRPVDDSTSKMQIRQRNPGRPSVAGIMLAPVGLLVFEPAHFIMQRAMLRGIRDRAERRSS